MADPLNIGTSALLAFQRALTTTGHNISNVNTEGYSRQRVELVTRPPQFTGSGFFGTVRPQTVQRIYDQFLVEQVSTSTTRFHQLDTLHGFASQVDDLLADPQAGLAPALQDLFNAVQEVANDPSSGPARQVLLSEAQTLVQRFGFLDGRLDDLREGVNIDLENSVSEINSLAEAIADVNADIARLGADDAQQPNDLLDQRDQLVRKLSELVGVSTFEQDDGTLNVFVGNGQSLVVGTTASGLTTTSNRFDPTRLEIAVVQGGSSVEISGQLTGGSLGGVLDFRNRILDSAQNALGRVATGLAVSFNNQHQLGLDLNGALGGDFFTAGTLQVLPNVDNAGGSVTGSIVDVGALTASDYELRYDGGNNYTLTRLSDGQSFAINTGGVSPYTTAQIDGFTLTITAGAAVGDTFLVQPTRTGAAEIDVSISEPSEIAAAMPIRASAGFSNGGSGVIKDEAVSDTTSLPLSANGGDIILTYDPNALGPGTPGFTVTNGPGGTLAYDPATESGGKSFTLGGAFSGISFTISGTPLDGDTFTITDNTNGVSDNRNALALGALQTAPTLRGNASYEDAYGQLVAEVGTTTRQAEVARDAQSVLLDQAIKAQQSVSGVNLDEEAAELVRYQQAYQAAAQVISVTDTLFQTLLASVRR